MKRKLKIYDLYPKLPEKESKYQTGYSHGVIISLLFILISSKIWGFLTLSNIIPSVIGAIIGYLIFDQIAYRLVVKLRYEK